HTPRETTPLQKELDRVGRILGLLVLVIAAAMIATIILVNGVHGFRGFLDALIVGVALAVAAVPEGLPAIVTTVLAIGVQRMARRNAIIRHLAAVETLGSADVIASDKTGTLTKNEMTVRTVVTASGRVQFRGTGYAPEGEVVIAHAGGAPAGAIIEGSSDRKLMTTVHTDADRQGRLLVFTKGAPDVLLARCSHELAGTQPRGLDEARRNQILEINEELAH